MQLEAENMVGRQKSAGVPSGMMVKPSVGKRIRKSLPYYILILPPLIYLLVKCIEKVGEPYEST